MLTSARPLSQGIGNRKDLRGSGCYYLVFHMLREPKIQVLLGTEESPVEWT